VIKRQEVPGPYKYGVYGLVLSSVLPLPELTPSTEAKADVELTLKGVDWNRRPAEFGEGTFQSTIGEACFHWDEIGSFLVRGGREIVVDPVPGVEERLVRLPLLGCVLAYLLYQRGFLVLHASGVAINGGAIAFIGNKGWGKSTLAASLYQRGHSLIADDVVALRVDHLGQAVMPSAFPQFKLYPESAKASLGLDVQSLPPLVDGYEKRACSASNRFSASEFPLRAIYLLSIGPHVRLTALRPQEALIYLVEHSYVARYGRQCLYGSNASKHFHQCASLLPNTPIYRLERPASLCLIPEVAQVVEEQQTNQVSALEYCQSV
jgi:hypothetical protein